MESEFEDAMKTVAIKMSCLIDIFSPDLFRFINYICYDDETSEKVVSVDRLPFRCQLHIYIVKHATL